MFEQYSSDPKADRSGCRRLVLHHLLKGIRPVRARQIFIRLQVIHRRLRAMQAEARGSRLFILQSKRLSCNSLLIVISSSNSALPGRRATSFRISRGFSCTTRRSTTFAPRWHAERLVRFLASSSTDDNSSPKRLQGRRSPFGHNLVAIHILSVVAFVSVSQSLTDRYSARKEPLAPRTPLAACA